MLRSDNGTTRVYTRASFVELNCISFYFVRMAGRAGPRHMGAPGQVNNLTHLTPDILLNLFGLGVGW